MLPAVCFYFLMHFNSNVGFNALWWARPPCDRASCLFVEAERLQGKGYDNPRFQLVNESISSLTGAESVCVWERVCACVSYSAQHWKLWLVFIAFVSWGFTDMNRAVSLRPPSGRGPLRLSSQECTSTCARSSCVSEHVHVKEQQTGRSHAYWHKSLHELTAETQGFLTQVTRTAEVWKHACVKLDQQ